MKKLTLLILLGLLFVGAKAQTTIKTNALYWTVGVINAGVETRLGNHFTFNADVVISPWAAIQDRPYLALQAIPELRYYFKESFKGFYLGAFTAFDLYKLSKWDHPSTDVQHGVGMCLGLTAGYQLAIAKRWSMDFYVGGGWHLGWYYGVNKITNDLYVGWNRSGEWIPYKVGVTFAYRLSK